MPQNEYVGEVAALTRRCSLYALIVLLKVSCRKSVNYEYANNWRALSVNNMWFNSLVHTYR
jgi:hypothetical protein